MKHRDIISLAALRGASIDFWGLIGINCVAKALLWKINVTTLQKSEKKHHFRYLDCKIMLIDAIYDNFDTKNFIKKF